MTTIPRRVPRGARVPVAADTSEVKSLASKWWVNKQLETKINVEQEGTAQEPGYRKRLLDIIKKTGRIIDPTKGHRAIPFDPPIGELHGLKAQRGTSTRFEVMLAEGMLRTKGTLALQSCIRVDWVFRPEKMGEVVEALEAAGILEQCVADGYPQRTLDPDLVLRYHQLHKDELTESDMDLLFPETETWSLITITEPLRDIPDVD